MKTTPLNDRLIQLTRYGFVNAYLVREDDGFTLVDTTMPRTGDALIAAATAAGAPIRRIALTHGHGDHVGSVDELKGKLGADVQVLLPELDARILAGEKVVEGKLTGSWPKVSWTPGRPPAARRHRGQPRGRPQPRATRRATSPSSTPATARSSPATCSPRSAPPRSPTTSTGASRWPRWPPSTRRRTCARPAPCARWTRRCWSSATARAVPSPAAAMDAAIARAAR